MKFVKSTEVREEDNNEATAIIRLSERMEVLSSAPYNGGEAVTDTIFIMQVPHDYNCRDYTADLAAKIKQYDLPEDSVGFMTAAEVKYVFSTSEDTVDNVTAFVAATAGVTNCVEAGQELDHWEERKAWSKMIYDRLVAGTINVVAVSPVPLTLTGKINLMIPLVEGKALAMRDLGYTESGTTSDAMAVVSPVSGKRSPFAGTGTPLGIAVGRGVRKAVAECVRKRGESPMTKDALALLLKAGVDGDMLWDCAKALGQKEEGRENFSSTLSEMAADGDVCAVTYAILEAGRMADCNAINGQYDGEPPEVLVDGTFDIFLAQKISEDRGGDAAVDLLNLRPLKDRGLKEYAEDAAYGLVAGVVGYLTGYTDD